jgi:hypothetical protein
VFNDRKTKADIAFKKEVERICQSFNLPKDMLNPFVDALINEMKNVKSIKELEQLEAKALAIVNKNLSGNDNDDE